MTTLTSEAAFLEAAFVELQAMRESAPAVWVRSLDCALRLIYREICALPPPKPNTYGPALVARAGLKR